MRTFRLYEERQVKQWDPQQLARYIRGLNMGKVGSDAADFVASYSVAGKDLLSLPEDGLNRLSGGSEELLRAFLQLQGIQLPTDPTDNHSPLNQNLPSIVVTSATPTTPTSNTAQECIATNAAVSDIIDQLTSSEVDGSATIYPTFPHTPNEPPNSLSTQLRESNSSDVTVPSSTQHSCDSRATEVTTEVIIPHPTPAGGLRNVDTEPREPKMPGAFDTTPTPGSQINLIEHEPTSPAAESFISSDFESRGANTFRDSASLTLSPATSIDHLSDDETNSKTREMDSRGLAGDANPESGSLEVKEPYGDYKEQQPTKNLEGDPVLSRNTDNPPESLGSRTATPTPQLFAAGWCPNDSYRRNNNVTDNDDNTQPPISANSSSLDQGEDIGDSHATIQTSIEGHAERSAADSSATFAPSGTGPGPVCHDADMQKKTDAEKPSSAEPISDENSVHLTSDKLPEPHLPTCFAGASQGHVQQSATAFSQSDSKQSHSGDDLRELCEIGETPAPANPRQVQTDSGITDSTPPIEHPEGISDSQPDTKSVPDTCRRRPALLVPAPSCNRVSIPPSLSLPDFSSLEEELSPLISPGARNTNPSVDFARLLIQKDVSSADRTLWLPSGSRSRAWTQTHRKTSSQDVDCGLTEMATLLEEDTVPHVGVGVQTDDDNTHEDVVALRERIIRLEDEVLKLRSPGGTGQKKEWKFPPWRFPKLS